VAVEVEFIPLFTLTSTATRNTVGVTTTYSPDQLWPVGHSDRVLWYSNVSANVTWPADTGWIIEAVLGPGGEGIGVRLKTTATVSEDMGTGDVGAASITVTVYYFRLVRLNSTRWGIYTPALLQRVTNFA